MNPYPGDAPFRDNEEISLFALGTVLIKHWRLIGLSTALVLGGLAPGIITSSFSYTAVASFMPQAAEAGGSSSSLRGLAGIAGQFGISVPSGSVGASPDFYVKLLKSPAIVSQVVSNRFTLTADEAATAPAMEGSLAELMEIAEAETDTARRRELAVRWFTESALSVSAELQTGVVTVSVETPWATLSRDIVQQLITLVSDFDRHTRQTRATAERSFLEGRLTVALDSLRAAEDRMAKFLDSNRQWEESPSLRFEHERINRHVTNHQQVLGGLSDVYEQARIAEVRNTPVITIVEPPTRPALPNPRGRLRKLFLAALAGGFIGMVLALTKTFADRAQTAGDEDFLEFRAAWRTALSEMRFPRGGHR